jgi:hypothetical protein
MSASDYVRQYHNLTVTALDAGGAPMSETVHVTRYQVVSTGERQKLLNALKKILGLKVVPNLATTTEFFVFPPGDVMGPEPFYWQGIRRAYNFKASPAEMRDVLRLAYRCGRIGKGKDVIGQPAAAMTMALYAHQCFGLDCNGMVGNYFDLSPEMYIECFAQMSAREEKAVEKNVDAHHGYWNGWGRAEVLSLPYLPLAPRKSASEAKTGDVLIDVESGGKHAHIAVVEDVTPVDKDSVSWRVVEWGQGTELGKDNSETAKDHHIHPIKTVKLTKGSRKDYGVGHASFGTRFRYLFAGPNVPFDPADWGRCGVEGA